MSNITRAGILILFCFQAAFCNSLILQGKQLYKQAQAQHDIRHMLQAHALFERIAVSEPDNWLARYYCALSEYQLCLHEMESDNLDVFSRYIDSAIAQLDQVLTLNANWSEAYLLLSNLYGIKIYALQLRGIYDQAPELGVKSLEYAHLAIETDTTNPRAYLTMGVIQLNMPEVYGGSPAKALPHLRKAIDLFESQIISDPLLPDWGHLQSYAWLGQTLEKMNNPQEALQIYQKALEIDPEFAWIKHDLLPKLNERLTAGN
jgi:tetratricopeptide (TPR) repeat protein